LRGGGIDTAVHLVQICRGRSDAIPARMKKFEVPAGLRRAVIDTIRHGLQADGIAFSILKLCCWFSVRRRAVSYFPSTLR